MEVPQTLSYKIEYRIDFDTISLKFKINNAWIILNCLRLINKTVAFLCFALDKVVPPFGAAEILFQRDPFPTSDACFCEIQISFKMPYIKVHQSAAKRVLN